MDLPRNDFLNLAGESGTPSRGYFLTCASIREYPAMLYVAASIFDS